MVVNFVLPVVMKIGEYLVAPAGCQFGYLIFYERNIKNLEKQVQKLEDKRSDILREVDAAKSRSDSIKTTVERWLTQAGELSNDANKFFEDEVTPNKECLNVIRFHLQLTLHYHRSLSPSIISHSKASVTAVAHLHQTQH